MLSVLHAAGIPSPRIYGLCDNPEAIVMDRMPGRADLATTDSETEAATVLLDFIPILARMHALPPEDFLKAPGLRMPRDARELAFTMFDHFETIYRAAKRRPEPEVTFAMRWLRRNVPAHRTKPAFITCDSGQFLFDKGRVTSVLDMELAHIGDPALDLASLMLRDMSEPLGDLTPAFRLYEELTGEPIDWDVIRYYIALWGIMTPMVTAHLNKDPPQRTQPAVQSGPGDHADPHPARGHRRDAGRRTRPEYPRRSERSGSRQIDRPAGGDQGHHGRAGRHPSGRMTLSSNTGMAAHRHAGRLSRYPHRA